MNTENIENNYENSLMHSTGPQLEIGSGRVKINLTKYNEYITNN